MTDRPLRIGTAQGFEIDKKLVDAGDGTHRELIAVAGDGDVIAVTPTVDTSAYANGDLVFDLTAITNAVRVAGETAFIKSLTIIDKDAQGAALDIWVAQGNTTLGALNAAPNITDANIAANRMHFLASILAGDYKTLSGAKIATRQDLSLEVKAGSATRDYYIAAVSNGSTPTYTAGGLVLLVGVIWK